MRIYQPKVQFPAQILVTSAENLSEGEDEGDEGQELYELFCELGLEGKIPAVSISGYPRLPVKRIGSNVMKLVPEVEAIIAR